MLDPSVRAVYDQFLDRRQREPATAWSDADRAILRRAALALAAAQETPFFPPILYVEPTNACNCTCVICPRQNMTRSVGMMDMDLFRSIIGQAAELGPSDIRLFNFGEPLLHPDLPAMIRYCRERRLDARFQSNGLLLKPPLTAELLESGLAYFGISVNGLTAEDYALIRPGFQLADLIANVRALRALAAERRRPIHIHINAQVPKPDTENRPEDIAAFKKTWFGLADSISISGLNYYDKVSVVSRGTVAAKRFDDRTFRKPDAQMVCTEPFDRLVIKWDGDVTACCPDFDGRELVGVLARQPLAEVWTGPAIERIRQALRARRYSEISLCRTCPKFCSDEFTILFQRT
jgi:hypothetical protein